MGTTILNWPPFVGNPICFSCGEVTVAQVDISMEDITINLTENTLSGLWFWFLQYLLNEIVLQCELVQKPVRKPVRTTTPEPPVVNCKPVSSTSNTVDVQRPTTVVEKRDQPVNVVRNPKRQQSVGDSHSWRFRV
ncbi:hypothetical protein CHUAL_013643 [Chamberlinius hualienensis]